MHPFEAAVRRIRPVLLTPEVVRRIVSAWQRTRAVTDAATGLVSTRPSLRNVEEGVADFVRTLLIDNKTMPDHEKFTRISSTVNTTYALLSYISNKRIYDINKRLFEDLRNVELPMKSPIECLFAPEDHAPVLVLPTIGFNWVIVSLDSGFEPVTETTCRLLNIKSIRIEGKGGGTESLLSVRLIPGMTIQDAFDLQIKAQKMLPNLPMSHMRIGEDPEFQRHLNGILATLAYMKSDRDVVSQVHPGKKKFDGWSLRAFAKSHDYVPEQLSVGDGYSKIIENYEDGIEQSGGVSGRSMRPHIRRPHAHLYHTKQGPIIHFLPPIPVKGADMASYDPEKPMKILVK